MSMNRVSKFGRVALDLGFLNIKQLEECLQLQIKYQKAGKEVPRLGSVLLSKKYITSKQLETILEKQKDSKYETASASTTNILQFFPAGTYIFKESEDSTDQLYLIHEGCVDFYRADSLVESISGKGNFFGDVAFLTSNIYTESAVTARDSKIFVIPKKEVHSFLKSRPEMGLKIAKKIAEKLHEHIIGSSPHLARTTKNSVMSSLESKATPELQVIDNSQEQTQANISDGIDASDTLEQKASFSTHPTEVRALDDQTSDELPAINQEILSENSVSPLENNKDKADSDEDDKAVITLSEFKGENIHEPEVISEAVDCSELLTIISSLTTKSFSNEVVSAVKDIVNIFIEIDELDTERTAFVNSKSNPSEILKSEINKQKKEAVRIPPMESLQNSYNRIKEILENDDKSEKNSPESDFDSIDTNIFNDEYDTFAEEQKPEDITVKTKIDATIKEAYSFSIRQKELLLHRYTVLPDVIKTCANYSSDEPFLASLLKHNIDAQDLFGWGVYQMALEEYSATQSDKILAIKNEREGLEANLKSLVDRLKMSKKAEEDREEQFKVLLQKEKKHKLIQSIVRREIKNIEKTIVNEFWQIYTKVSHLLITELSGIDKVMTKCFLRWGLLGYNSKWIDKDRCINFITLCSSELTAPIYSISSNYSYYADEIIELTAKGYIPTSPNEDLELNHRNSPEWKCDKAYKRYCYLKLQYGVLVDILKIQTDEVNSIAEKLDSALNREASLRKLHSKTPQHKAKISAVKQEIQGYKVRSTRINNIIVRITDEMLPKIVEDIESAMSNVEKSGIKLSVSNIITHEVSTIRRCCRLVAKLKEPFLPFVLRDRYKEDNDIVNSREYITELVDEFEKKDSLIFQTKLVPSAARKQRVLVRKSPFILIAPSCGILGFVISPRSGLENGRFTIPAYYEKSMMSKDVFTSVLADFRFDCSKADAGVDIMTSDTLVAAYATYRWNMRKKKKEVRMKAAVYLDETERLNWRRHYSQYIKSAYESGKYLFFKCPDLYDVIINKFIDLPEACEKLKR